MREKVAVALAFILACTVWGIAAFGQPEALLYRSYFVMMAVWLTVFLYPLGKGKTWRTVGAVIDGIFIVIAGVVCVYIHVNYDRIMLDLPVAEAHDLFMTGAMLLIFMELARRTVGIVFPIILMAGLLYAACGQYISGPLGHRGFDVYFLTETIFLSDLGMWGLLVGVAATTVASFILFGAILLHTGGGNTFMDLSMILAGKSPGGAAKIATVASGLFGMVSGSAVANVATTGNFTIPLMRRLKYPSALAGAVEAVASTGGQIAPPIMGAGAFIMAELTGVPYWSIALAALIPALIYYSAVYMTVHYYAKHHRLGMVPDDQIPSVSVLKDATRVLPLVAGFAGIGVGVYFGRSVPTIAFYGIMGMIATYCITMFRRGRIKEAFHNLGVSLIDAGKGMVIIVILLASAQVLVSLINLTGIGVAVASIIVGLADEHILVLAPIVAAVCLVLGMGLPTTAAYVLAACVMAPAMSRLGIDPLVAHMFIFYYATLSVVTPPVCTAVFVAAGIAEAPWLAVAKYAVMLAGVTYVVPVLFFFYPGLLWQGGMLAVADAFVSGMAFTVAAASIFGQRRILGNRVVDVAIFCAVIVLSLTVSWLAAAGAWLILGYSFYAEWRRERKSPVALAPATPPDSSEEAAR